MRSRLTHVAPLAAAMLLPAVRPLRAQAAYELTPYAATNRSVPGIPTIYGLSLTSFAGIFGVRVGGAVGQLRTERGVDNVERTHAGAWTADADLVLAPSQARAFRIALGGLEPYGFMGIGTNGVHPVGAPRVQAAMWSWGGGLTQSIAGPLALQTEARWRTPVVGYDNTVPEGFHGDWELRGGLTIRFGGARSRGRGGSDDWPSSGRSRVHLPAPTSRGGDRTSGRSTNTRAVLDEADDYLGTPYVFGGTSPDGFDCSGFVQYVYRRNGVALPRTSREQAYAGDGVAAAVSSLRAGDLVFFSTHGSRIDHVAIYAGDRRIIHSSSSGGGVRFDDLTTARGRWFVDHMVAARRVMTTDGRPAFDFARVPQGLREELDPPDGAPQPQR